MDFSYSDEQQMLQDSVQKFVQRHYSFDDRRELLESEQGFSAENWKLFAELGWLTVPFKVEDDGFGGLATDLMVLMEEFGKAMVVEPFVANAVLGGGLLSELGSAEQKAEYLPKIMEGGLQLAAAITEAGARNNLANISCSASKLGDGYELNGEKIVVLNGPAAELLVVSARTGGEQLDETGISLFLVDANAEGVKKHSYTNIDGHRAAEISFDKVKLAQSALLGGEGEAYATLVSVADKATLAVCSEAVGAMDALLQKTVEYAKTRKQFGTAIGSFQALQHRMADMFIECQLARSITIMAAMKLDGDEDETAKQKAVSAAKARVGKAIRTVGQEAVQLHGGIGITDELDVGHLFKRVTAIETMFGNTDFHTKRFAAL
ncbi:MAG: acyl-CoA dehydrogenase [Pseudohongiellaceae bacterium]|nr:acyl-CoA dehydrogenase [Pseudohongiellaceae bacterium]